jgi:predicted porin
MQYKLTAAAALALCAVNAHAQSSVTLFGVIDVGILSQSNFSSPALGYLPSSSDKGSMREMKDSGLGQSFWGLRGSEDLGNGMKANFNLQGNFLANNGTAGGPNSAGTSSLFNQQANVGLSGDFGSLQAGRVISPVYYAFAGTDVRGAAYFGSILTALVGMNSATGTFSGANSNASLGSVYNDNAIVYVTPKLSGFEASFEYAFGGVAGDSSALRQEAATLTYKSNNLKFDALIYNGNDDGVRAATSPNGSNTNRLVSAGILYKIDALSMDAGYTRGTNPANSGAGINPAALGGAATTSAVNLINLGLGYRVSTQINLTSGAYLIQDENHSGNKSNLFALGLDYTLSKQTQLYVEGANVHNRGSNMNQAPAWAAPVTAGVTTSAFMAGVRHMF